MVLAFPTKLQIPQMPNSALEGKLVTLNSTYIEDIEIALEEWSCFRVLVITAWSSGSNTEQVERLLKLLRSKYETKVVDILGHGRFSEALSIAVEAKQCQADVLIYMGCHGDAVKIARLLLSSCTAQELREESLRKLIDPKTGATYPKILKPPQTRLIAIPRSLCVSDYNPISIATDEDGTKLKFGEGEFIPALPDLILLDPQVALSVESESRFLPFGAYAIEYAIETICCRVCEEEGRRRAKNGLEALVRGLKTYKEQIDAIRGGQLESRVTKPQVAHTQIRKVHSPGQYDFVTNAPRSLLSAVSYCQQGTRDAITGVISYKSICGPSHAITQQLADITSIPLDVASSIILPAVLRYEKFIDPVGRTWNVDSQKIIVNTFNEVMGWDEQDAGDAVERFFKFLDIPTSLSEVAMWMVKDIDSGDSTPDIEDVLRKIAWTTVHRHEWVGGLKQIEDSKAVLGILQSVR